MCTLECGHDEELACGGVLHPRVVYTDRKFSDPGDGLTTCQGDADTTSTNPTYGSDAKSEGDTKFDLGVFRTDENRKPWNNHDDRDTCR